MIARILLNTTPNIEVARKIASSAVENSLAACVSIIPEIESVYKWEDQIHNDNEVQLIFKTSESKINELKNLILSLHPYECPELISLSVDYVEEEYYKWMKSILINEKE